MKHPESAALAQQAFTATEAKSHVAFCELTRGAVALRTFRRWLAGEGPVDEMARQYLKLIATGWRPPSAPLGGGA